MMEIADEITIPAPRAVVYEALNDIAILKACIPGCESLERESDIKLVAKVKIFFCSYRECPAIIQVSNIKEQTIHKCIYV